MSGIESQPSHPSLLDSTSATRLEKAHPAETPALFLASHPEQSTFAAVGTEARSALSADGKALISTPLFKQGENNLAAHTPSIKQLCADGIFKPANKHIAQELKTLTGTSKAESQVDAIKIVDATRAKHLHIKNPDFIVKADGTMQINNPHLDLSKNKKEIVVEVEKPKTALEVDRQNKNLNWLVNQYLKDRYLAKKDGEVTGLILDEQKLLAAKPVKFAMPPLPEHAHKAVEQIQKDFPANGFRQMTAKDVNGYFPERHALAGESNAQRQDMETLGALYSGRERSPYEAVQRNDRGWSVGYYALTYNLILKWLDDLCGFPPDAERLEKLVKTGKLPLALAKTLLDPKFMLFMDKLHDAKASEEEIKGDLKRFMPADVQERIAGDLRTQFVNELTDKNGNVDPKVFALAWNLGRVPTADDLKNPKYQDFMKSADTLHSLSKVRPELDDNSLVDWEGKNGLNKLRISSPFGHREAPTRGASTEHHGMDLAYGAGTEVKASTPGEVIAAGHMRGFGHGVRVKYGGLVVTYGHLGEVDVKVGQKVEVGQMLGRIGQAEGISTGPHLHFQTEIHGKAVNPLKVAGLASPIGDRA